MPPLLSYFFKKDSLYLNTVAGQGKDAMRRLSHNLLSYQPIRFLLQQAYFPLMLVNSGI